MRVVCGGILMVEVEPGLVHGLFLVEAVSE